MTKYTVFTTRSELDLKAITTFGINVKPNSNNPIGFFGTGLKYAIAVLLRNNIPLTIYTGGSEYKFYTKEIDFRDKTFKTCRYRKSGFLNKFTYHELPFTTELGKNWELWQAFRELYSNTLDEQGILYTYDNPIQPNPKYTHIVIEGEKFADVVAKRDEIFLPKDKLKLVAANNDIEVYEGTSRYIYFRGLRAYDLKEYEKETMYTYNYIGSRAELTEDRTIKYIFYVRDAIASLVCKSTDRKFIGSIIKPADRYFEKDLDYASYYSKSTEFNSVVYNVGRSRVSSSMNNSTRSYYSDVLEPTINPKESTELEVSDKVWDKIKQVLNDLSETNVDDGYLNALNDVEKELAKEFGRESDIETITEFNIEDLPKDLPPGTYNAQISDVKIEGNKITTTATLIDSDDIPF